jgi:multicomponent Na+:H+ antiporter subunit D
MSWLPVAAFAIPGIAGICLWLFPARAVTMRRVALVFALLQLGTAMRIVGSVTAGKVLVHGFGSWSPPFGIVFVADRLAALFLGLLGILLLFTVASLRPTVHGEKTVSRALPVLFVLAFGLSGAFLTGDLFNLFVMFEVVLLASYLLLQVPGSERSLQAAFPNIAINLVASIFFFVGVGLIYGVCGTVNLADLASRIELAPPDLRLAAFCMLVLAFGIKAGLAPFLYWLPATYPAFSGPVAALFAGMMTKLGVYALLRTVPLLMRESALPGILVWAGAISALLAVLAALSEYEVRRLLGFHITSQVGYMVLGLGLMTRAAIAGAVFYLVHHVLVKAILFFVADDLERRNATRDLRRMRPGIAGPAVTVAFIVGAFSLAGLPPFSGFFAKLGLLRGVLEADSFGALAVLVVASFYTLASMLKIWEFAFRRSTDAGAPVSRSRRFDPVLGLGAVSILMAVAAGPVFRYAEQTAAQLLDIDAYVAAVGETPGRSGGSLP